MKELGYDRIPINESSNMYGKNGGNKFMMSV